MEEIQLSRVQPLLPQFHLRFAPNWVPILAESIGNWQEESQALVSDELEVLSSKILASGFALALPTFIPNLCSYDGGTPVNIAAAQPKAIGISGPSKNNYTQSNVVSPFYKIGSAQSSSKPSSIQGWHATMKDAHASYPDLGAATFFFGVCDGALGQILIGSSNA
ncbi:hypothetical protein SLE2022_322160 [Rubroshorea leprosula]